MDDTAESLQREAKDVCAHSSCMFHGYSVREMDRLLEDVSERGARRALAAVGLSDRYAGKDIRQLRGLLDSWRSVKGDVLRQIGKGIKHGATVLFLAMMLLLLGKSEQGQKLATTVKEIIN